MKIPLQYPPTDRPLCNQVIEEYNIYPVLLAVSSNGSIPMQPCVFVFTNWTPGDLQYPLTDRSLCNLSTVSLRPLYPHFAVSSYGSISMQHPRLPNKFPNSLILQYPLTDRSLCNNIQFQMNFANALLAVSSYGSISMQLLVRCMFSFVLTPCSILLRIDLCATTCQVCGRLIKAKNLQYPLTDRSLCNARYRSGDGSLCTLLQYPLSDRSLCNPGH